MKASRYNLFFPINEHDEYVAYNTLTGGVAVLDGDLKARLEDFGPDHGPPISPTLLDGFKEAGFLVDTGVDEGKIYEAQFNARKYTSEELWVNVMTTYACNLACGYCYQGHGDILSMTMKKATTDALTRFIQNYTLESGCSKLSLMLYGGEPLINHREAFRLIDNLDTWATDHEIDFGTGFITNGTLFTPEIAEKMKGHKQRINQLTLDGPKHIHDRRRIYKNGSGTYDRIIGALQLLTEYEVEGLFLRIDVDKDNIDHMEELLDDLMDKNLQHIPIGFGLIRDKTPACSSWSNYCMDGEESKQMIPDLWAMALKKGFDLRLRPQAFFVYCGAQTNFSIMIDPVGDVYKCSNFLGMKEHRVGSILEDGSLSDLHYEYYDWMARNPMNMEACRTCEVLPMCGGGCAGLAFQEHGTFHKEMCAEIKYLIQDQLLLYLKNRNPSKFRAETYKWE